MILIVDDSATNQVLLEAILHEEGFQTQTAFSVKEALSAIEKTLPQLILLDLLMPEVSGFSFLERVKMEKDFAHIPIIVVSAVSTKENRERCMELGAADFISKPIDMPLFLNKVKRFKLN